MQLTKLETLMEASKQGMKKITAIAWSPNNKRLAVVTVERVVYVYDEQGERKDKFATKPANKGDKDYIVRSIAFSPDSAKLAVAQSDNIVFVYHLGLDWSDQKRIKHKFQQTSPVTCLTWPAAQPHEFVYGSADGKVKVGQLRSNKAAVLYQTDSYVVSSCSSPDGKSILTGHLDGSIYSFHFDETAGGGLGSAYSKFCHHPCPPYALAWGASILAAGADRRVVFYDNYGNEQRTFDYASDDSDVKEFSVAECNPSGRSIVVGNFNQFFVFDYSSARETWDEHPPKKVPNYYTVTALAWKPDGSKLAIGTLCGCLDLYDACIKRSRYNGTFEFTYVSPSQVIVKRISNGQRLVLKSIFEKEIDRINVYGDDRYIVASTTSTIICGDMETCKMSEIPWSFSGNEKYIFDNPSVCMIYSAGELTMVEYGRNEILSSCRTEHVKPTLVSVRVNERPPKNHGGGLLAESKTDGLGGGATIIPTLSTFADDNDFTIKSTNASGNNNASANHTTPDNKKIAYLLDQMTIRVMDLASGYTDATINHTAKIDWMELNARADLLLYRDKRRQLHLYNIHKQSRTTLLTYCNYVQWVPESDVVVAQNRGNLCVWYNIEAPEKVTIIPIQGEVEEIERVDGKTEVRVDEGINTVVYCLDEALIGFGSALEDGNLTKAMTVLERQCEGKDPSELRPEMEAMWKQLSIEALAQGRLDIAERSHAAVGDVAMTRYLRKVNKTKMQVTKATGGDGNDHWIVRAKLALLRRDFRDAELIYLEQGQTDEAVEMYQILHQWDEAIRVAEERNHPDAEEMRTSYFDYLVSSGQEAKAAQIRESDGEYFEAIDLYLKGGRPAKAMNVVNSYKRNYKTEVLERIANALTSSGMHDKAGGFFERMGQVDRALESYLKGNAYRNAVELARREFPAQVVRLEEAWGDWLVQNKNMDAAISHYIEANASKKAIEAALGARQWTKAGQLVDTMQASDQESARPYYKRIARHYHQAHQFDRAENFYLQANCEKDAIQMYTEAGMWDAAHKLATQYMSSQEVSNLYHKQAHMLEAKGKFKEAESLLLTVKSVDKAISMYKKARKYDHMIRLVAAYRKDLLKDTHLHLAGQLEMEGNLKQAEEHYAQAGEWPAAVNMYTANDLWDEAIRVAKYYGGVAASRKVAYQWAKILGGEAGAKLLTKLGLIEQAIDYAIETSSFQEALELAKTSLPVRIPEVHLKYALYLEDEERFTEAEAEFIKAEKPKEAIEMYCHQQDWTNAMRVAEKYDPSSISEVLVSQAKVAVDSKQFANAEVLFLNAKKPEFALHMYQENGMWHEAIAFAKKHLPHRLQDINRAYEQSTSSISRSMGASSVQESPAASPGANGRGSPRQRGGYEPSTRLGGSGNLMESIRAAMESAKIFEDSGEFSKAVDCYLHIGPEDLRKEPKPSPEEVDLMVVAWDRAVRIASQQLESEYSEVVEQVADKLVQVSRFNAAGDLYEEIDRHQEAVECYIKAKKWDKAREVTELAPAYKDMVDRAYKAQMKTERNPAELLKVGDFDTALSLLADQGDWARVFEIVEGGDCPSDLGSKFAADLAGRLLENTEVGSVPPQKIDDAVSKLARYGSPHGTQHFALFCRLTQEILGRQSKQIILPSELEDSSSKKSDATIDFVSALRNLREVLFNHIRQRTSRGSRAAESKMSGESHAQTLERLLLAVHLSLMHYVCLENGSSEMATNIAICLLRFAGDALPSDKAFYMAGIACKKMEWTGKAFVLLNRYLDLTEAIDEGELGDLDNSDFRDTDIPPPHKQPLPTFHYLQEDKREEIREWILGAAMDTQIEQEPFDMDWLQDIRSQVADQLSHIVRRFDRGAMPIEEFLVQVRQQYLGY